MSDQERDCQASASRDCPASAGGPVVERILARASVIGADFTIRRALPSRQRRMVGTWCFLDQAGPVSYGAGQGLHVGPHPHIGLQTFTWMIEGEILHRDSLGFEQIVRPGQVNLMTAGSGIAHAEDAVTDAPGRLHAAQLWIALPDAQRHREPAFQHCPTCRCWSPAVSPSPCWPAPALATRRQRKPSRRWLAWTWPALARPKPACP